MEQDFDPTQFGFVRLRDFQLVGEVATYEYCNHPTVDGSHDFLRFNVYLTKDHNYVTIWHGLLEPLAIEAEFETGRLKGIDPSLKEVLTSGDEQLFRGYIDSAEAAKHIFNALRVGGAHQRYREPQVLRVSPDKQVGWFSLSERS